jgi:hypothetical protein
MDNFDELLGRVEVELVFVQSSCEFKSRIRRHHYLL